MIKTLSIHELNAHLNGKIWEKGTMCRIYLNRGYNTKKMSTKTYVYKDDAGHYHTSCTIDCPSQHDNWIEAEEKKIIESLNSRIVDIIEEFGIEQEEVLATPIDVVINNAILDSQPVIGYYTEWRQVRVAINRFGKLATRNRQFVVAFSGTKNTAPKGFIELSKAAYDVLAARTNGEECLEPYAPVPDYDERAIRYAAAKTGPSNN
jgi:hypothetical protein